MVLRGRRRSGHADQTVLSNMTVIGILVPVYYCRIGGYRQQKGIFQRLEKIDSESFHY